MNLTITEADRERIETALRFYVDRVQWASGDEEKAAFERLLDEVAYRGLRDALVESLRDNGMEAKWAGYTADAFYGFAGVEADWLTHAMMSPSHRADLIDQMLEDDIDVQHADYLVESLAAVLAQNARVMSREVQG